MAYKTKRELEREKRIRESIQRILIKREIRQMGREPVPGEIEKLIEERKYKAKVKNPVTEYYSFYLDRIIPLIPNIKDNIEKSKMKEIKMYVDDFARKVTMIGKKPLTIITKSKPALLIEEVSANLGDKGKFIVMKRATKEEKLTGLSKNLADRVCMTDPQTDNLRIIEFQDKICWLSKK